MNVRRYLLALVLFSGVFLLGAYVARQADRAVVAQVFVTPTPENPTETPGPTLTPVPTPVVVTVQRVFGLPDGVVGYRVIDVAAGRVLWVVTSKSGAMAISDAVQFSQTELYPHP